MHAVDDGLSKTSTCDFDPLKTSQLIDSTSKIIDNERADLEKPLTHVSSRFCAVVVQNLDSHITAVPKDELNDYVYEPLRTTSKL